MRIKSKFSSRREAIEYLKSRGWTVVNKTSPYYFNSLLTNAQLPGHKRYIDGCGKCWRITAVNVGN